MGEPWCQEAPRPHAEPAETQRGGSGGSCPCQYRTRSGPAGAKAPGKRVACDGVPGGNQMPKTEQHGCGDYGLPLRCTAPSPDPLCHSPEGSLFEKGGAKRESDKCVEEDVTSFLADHALVQQKSLNALVSTNRRRTNCDDPDRKRPNSHSCGGVPRVETKTIPAASAATGQADQADTDSNVGRYVESLRECSVLDEVVSGEYGAHPRAGARDGHTPNVASHPIADHVDGCDSFRP